MLWREKQALLGAGAPERNRALRFSMPENQAELLTLQSRRILLIRSEECPGSRGLSCWAEITWTAKVRFAEQMTIWRRTSKENEKLTCMNPARGKQLWRELPAVFGPGGP